MRPKIKPVVASCALSTYRLVGWDPTVSQGDRSVAFLVMNHIRLRLLPSRRLLPSHLRTMLSIALDLLAVHCQNDAIGWKPLLDAIGWIASTACSSQHAIFAVPWLSDAFVKCFFKNVRISCGISCKRNGQNDKGIGWKPRWGRGWKTESLG